MEEAFQIPIRARRGSQLMLFVENQGRINFGPFMTDYKVGYDFHDEIG